MALDVVLEGERAVAASPGQSHEAPDENDNSTYSTSLLKIKGPLRRDIETRIELGPKSHPVIHHGTRDVRICCLLPDSSPERLCATKGLIMTIDTHRMSLLRVTSVGDIMDLAVVDAEMAV